MKTHKLPDEETGKIECFHCGAKAVGWEADFDPEDYGYEGTGIIHNCHCYNCGADIQYVILDNQEES